MATSAQPSDKRRKRPPFPWIEPQQTEYSDKAGVWDIWRCSVCNQPYPYRRKRDGRFGGPIVRGLDRRYGFLPTCVNFECKTHGRKLTDTRVTLLSTAAPNPQQPEQDPALLETIEALKAGKKRTRRS